MTHTHLCEHCGELFDCEGRQTANPDGIPDLWCDRYHGDNETWCDLCLGQMLEDQAHDQWWAGTQGSDGAWGATINPVYVGNGSWGWNYVGIQRTVESPLTGGLGVTSPIAFMFTAAKVHDEWWAGIGSDLLDAQHEETDDGATEA